MKTDRIAVLGSEGQIGKPLCAYLKAQGKEVVEVDIKNSPVEDLRSLSGDVRQRLTYCDAVIFLAFDIGGSKFLDTKQDDFEFLQNNVKIMDNVFSYLKESGKPFIFASSMMARIAGSPYGNLKVLGERYAKTLDGISTRFWNVYGPEEFGEKSHVITDFIHKAYTTGEITMRSNGEESRDFLHAEDLSRALLEILESYDKVKKDMPLHIAYGKYTWIIDIANMVRDEYQRRTGKSVSIKIGKEEYLDHNQIWLHPFNYPKTHGLTWEPKISLIEGVRQMFDAYEESR